MDNGKMYRLDESKGEQLRCNILGIPIKPFDPRITGRYNYDQRKYYTNKHGVDAGPVELPQTLKPNYKRNYLPQMNHIEGYAAMPRPLAPPY